MGKKSGQKPTIQPAQGDYQTQIDNLKKQIDNLETVANQKNQTARAEFVDRFNKQSKHAKNVTARQEDVNVQLGSRLKALEDDRVKLESQCQALLEDMVNLKSQVEIRQDDNITEHVSQSKESTTDELEIRLKELEDFAAERDAEFLREFTEIKESNTRCIWNQRNLNREFERQNVKLVRFDAEGKRARLLARATARECQAHRESLTVLARHLRRLSRKSLEKATEKHSKALKEEVRHQRKALKKQAKKQRKSLDEMFHHETQEAGQTLYLEPARPGEASQGRYEDLEGTVQALDQNLHDLEAEVETLKEARENSDNTTRIHNSFEDILSELYRATKYINSQLEQRRPTTEDFKQLQASVTAGVERLSKAETDLQSLSAAIGLSLDEFKRIEDPTHEEVEEALSVNERIEDLRTALGYRDDIQDVVGRLIHDVDGKVEGLKEIMVSHDGLEELVKRVDAQINVSTTAIKRLDIDVQRLEDNLVAKTRSFPSRDEITMLLNEADGKHMSRDEFEKLHSELQDEVKVLLKSFKESSPTYRELVQAKHSQRTLDTETDIEEPNADLESSNSQQNHREPTEHARTTVFNPMEKPNAVFEPRNSQHDSPHSASTTSNAISPPISVEDSDSGFVEETTPAMTKPRADEPARGSDSTTEQFLQHTRQRCAVLKLSREKLQTLETPGLIKEPEPCFVIRENDSPLTDTTSHACESDIQHCHDPFWEQTSTHLPDEDRYSTYSPPYSTDEERSSTNSGQWRSMNRRPEPASNDAREPRGELKSVRLWSEHEVNVLREVMHDQRTNTFMSKLRAEECQRIIGDRYGISRTDRACQRKWLHVVDGASNVALKREYLPDMRELNRFSSSFNEYDDGDGVVLEPIDGTANNFEEQLDNHYLDSNRKRQRRSVSDDTRSEIMVLSAYPQDSGKPTNSTTNDSKGHIARFGVFEQPACDQLAHIRFARTGPEETAYLDQLEALAQSADEEPDHRQQQTAGSQTCKECQGRHLKCQHQEGIILLDGPSEPQQAGTPTAPTPEPLGVSSPRLLEAVLQQPPDALFQQSLNDPSQQPLDASSQQPSAVPMFGTGRNPHAPLVEVLSLPGLQVPVPRPAHRSFTSCFESSTTQLLDAPASEFSQRLTGCLFGNLAQLPPRAPMSESDSSLSVPRSKVNLLQSPEGHRSAPIEGSSAASFEARSLPSLQALAPESVKSASAPPPGATQDEPILLDDGVDANELTELIVALSGDSPRVEEDQNGWLFE